MNSNRLKLLREFIKDTIMLTLFKESLINEEVVDINKDEAVSIINNTKGKIFTVIFTKKDGTERVMNARTGVKQYLKGGELPYSPSEKGLIPVYDLQKRSYRMVNIGTIKTIKVGNNIYSIK